MSVDHAEMYRVEQARQRVQALKTRVPLERYVGGLARRREILPGSEAPILDVVTRPLPVGPRPNYLGHLGVPAPERPAPLPTGNGHADLVARCVAYLEGDGARYKNPTYKPDPDEQPMVAIVRRLGMSKESAEKFYADNAVALAGRTGASLAQGVFHALTTIEDGKYLGVEPPNPNPEPDPAPAPAWKPGDNGGAVIGGVFYANPPAEPRPAPTAADRILTTVRGAF